MQKNKIIENINILPKPVSIEIKKGAFVLSDNSKISCSSELNELGILFSQQIESILEFRPIVTSDAIETNTIVLKFDKTISEDEGYKLNISSDKVVISGKNRVGIFYGIQSFLQVFPSGKQSQTDITLPCLTITDHPRFKWRGMHLDEARHFFGVDFVKTMIDQMSIIKMNRFHWHLVDDQGWRIEIKKHPKLTNIGAWRVDNENGKWNYSVVPAQEGKPKYGGFYTQEEIKEIVAYAAARSIIIVPEIEMPGHVTSMIFAYPELSCKGKPSKLGSDMSFEFSDPLCAGNEETFKMLEDVLSEVIELFPSEYIHIGGDECKKTPWETCSRCQSRIKDEKLKNVEELQSYFIKRIEKFVLSKGRRIIGWDEILEGGLAPEATVMSWRGTQGGIEAANQGHQVIMSPTSFCYFDFYQGKGANEPKAIGGFLPLSKVYQFDPIPHELPKNKHHLILGGQANIWTEHMFTPEHVQYMTYPRIFAMAEVLWTEKNRLNYDDFLLRLSTKYSELSSKGINFRLPTPEGLGEKKIVSKDTLITIINSMKKQGAVIRYTTDGLEPDNNSLIYEKPIKIVSTTNLKAKLFFDGSVSNTSLSWFFVIDEKINGLSCDYFEGEWTKLPNFDKLSVINSARVLEISGKSPNKRVDNYALRYRSNYLIDESGEYTFYLSSDDGSRILIDGKQIVDYDGVHAADIRTGKVTLEKGIHAIEIQFFEATGGESLEVGTISELGEKIPLNLAKLFIE